MIAKNVLIIGIFLSSNFKHILTRNPKNCIWILYFNLIQITHKKGEAYFQFAISTVPLRIGLEFLANVDY